MAPGKLSKRYAKALFDLALEHKAHETVSGDLRAVGELLTESVDLREVFRNPRIDTEKKEAVLTSLLDRMKVHQLTRSFLFIVLNKGRILLVPAVATEMQQSLDQSVGRICANVTSAAPLEATDLKAIQESLSTALGAKEVRVEASVDPLVLGGVITRIGNLILDGSVRTQLNKIATRQNHN